MSWKDNAMSLVESGKVQKAAIIGQQGGVWGASDGFTLTPAEQKAIVNGFSNPADLQANGIHLAGRKFFTLQCNEDTIYGKQGADGCVIVKTRTGVIVAEYIQPIQAAEARLAVQTLVKHLEEHQL